MPSVRLLHTATGHRAAVYALAPGLEPGAFLSAGGDGWIAEWRLDNPETGRLLASTESPVFALCVLEDRQKIVAGTQSGELNWIEPGVPEATRRIQHHRKGVFALQPAGSYLFSAGADGFLTRWETASARPLESLQLSAQPLRALAVSAARRELAVAGTDQSIHLLDLDTLALRHHLPDAHSLSVFCVAYSPDGRFLLTGGRDAMLKVWDLGDNLALLSQQPAHLATVNHLAFSPDGRLFATAGRDRAVKIWSAADFQLLKVLDARRYGLHRNSVNRLIWLPEVLVSASDDRTVGIWKVED